MQYVYLLKCNDETIYTGCTTNLEERLKRHRKGEFSYTSKRLPVEVITYIAFTDKYKAYNFEKYLKSGSGKAILTIGTNKKAHLLEMGLRLFTRSSYNRSCNYFRMNKYHKSS